MSLYLEEFKTIEERNRDLESQRQQEQQIKEAEERVKRELELAEQESQRQRAAEVIDVTKVLASVGAQQSKLQSSPSSQTKQGNYLLIICFCCRYFFIYLKQFWINVAF